MPRLYGERIMLREYRREDLETMVRWVNDPEVADCLSDVFLFPHSRTQTEKFLESVLEGTANLHGFVIAGRESEGYIGQVDLRNIDWVNRVAEVGIVIGDPGKRGTGLGTEALCLLRDFAFYRANLNRLQLEVHAFNERAYRCYRRCGFTEEGRRRQVIFRRGRYYDSILMGLLKEDLPARPDALCGRGGPAG